ncbi:ChrB domain-containing protein [uncultured spirochete]|uniref:ChrB domain-containing protein n=1 Tax=uncultured spirochete TaxID=156406 RepID=A0A3P3XSP1_9SPIR|nr:ChrB domain-containing protein [uncultured spirochete]
MQLVLHSSYEYTYSMEDHSTWLLFAYQVPASPSTHRSYVWRKLKALGALYLQNSICILPSIEPVEETLRQLHAEIINRNGAAIILHVNLLNEEERTEIIARFRRQMEDEYGEFIEECGEFHAELTKERARHQLTYGELEENDVDLGKLRLWLPKLRVRDFFQVDTATKAAEALESCEADFSQFESEVEEASRG